MLRLDPYINDDKIEEFFGKKSKKSYYNKAINNDDLDKFSQALKEYLAKLDEIKAKEEKDIVQEALRDKLFKVFYSDDEIEAGYKQNLSDKKIQGSIDFVIKKDSHPVVICEAKKPKSSEMITKDEANKKSLHQAILYYFRQRQKSYTNNESFGIKYIIISNFYEFFLFKKEDFEDFFYYCNEIKDLYDDSKSLLEKDLKQKSNDIFYTKLENILNSKNYANFIAKKSLKPLYLNLNELKNKEASQAILRPYYKAFSREFLLGEYSKEKDNITDKFYTQLLSIIGLKTDKSKKTLIPNDKDGIKGEENTIYRAIYDNIANNFKSYDHIIALIIVWLNRILFLKLIEANLKKFNPKDDRVDFFNYNTIKNFDILNKLFFKIFNKNLDQRESLKELEYFKDLPYLNSSLFNISDIETELNFDISKLVANKELLKRLLDFLDRYDFGSGIEDKTLINSSVLGNVFERLNAYKDGSFYTPSAITSYMSKESLEKVVLNKFKENYIEFDHIVEYSTLCKNIKHKIDSQTLKDQIKLKIEYTKLLNSIRICDPAVGSGHFLVAVLNQMIKIYHDLGLINDHLASKAIELKDDEIIIKDFVYLRSHQPQDPSYQIQKAIFDLKAQIIENNIFGVDINTNSVEICKLRLWIELLKNSYYINKDDKDYNISFKNAHQMQTLPNIDINIKVGNSLVSYIPINDPLFISATEQIKLYQELEKEYFYGDYIDKNEHIKKINQTKQKLINLYFKNKFKKELEKLKQDCDIYTKSYGDYGKDELNHHYEFLKNNIYFNYLLNDDINEEKAKEALDKLKQSHDKIFSLDNNFEWRIEFAKLLDTGLSEKEIKKLNKNKNLKDTKGAFLGFDLIIGNPPYMQVPKNVYSAKTFPYSEGRDMGKQNTYKVFIEQGYNLAKNKGEICLIVQSSIMCDMSAKYTRELLLKNTKIDQFIEFPKNIQIFKEVIQGVCIVQFSKSKPQNNLFKISIHNNQYLNNFNFEIISQDDIIKFFPAAFEIPLIKNGEINIINKVKNNKSILKNFIKNSLQGNINTIHLHKIKSDIPTKYFLIKGDRIHKYYLDKELMYCKIIKETTKIIKRNQESGHIIAMQGISGTNDTWRLHCTLLQSKNTNKFVFLDSTKMLFVECKEIAIYLTGLLNSKLLDWLFRKTSTNNNINIYELESLPIPKINKTNQNITNSIINLVDKILNIKAKDNKTDTKELENQIDKLVYKLYDLNVDEIELIEKHNNQ